MVTYFMRFEKYYKIVTSLNHKSGNDYTDMSLQYEPDVVEQVSATQNK